MEYIIFKAIMHRLDFCKLCFTPADEGIYSFHKLRLMRGRTPDLHATRGLLYEIKQKFNTSLAVYDARESTYISASGKTIT